MVTPNRAVSLATHLLVAAVAILFIPRMWAQMPANSGTTSTPLPGAGHDYLGELNETVNPASGSLSLRISPTIPPGRGLTLPFSFSYDSNGVNYVGLLSAAGNFGWEVPSSTIVSTGGWSESVPVTTATEITWTATDENGKPAHCYGFVNYVYQDPNGNRHNLNLTNYNYAADGSACANDTTDWPTGFSGDVETQGGEGITILPVQGAIIGVNSRRERELGATVGPVTVTQPDGTMTFYFTHDLGVFGAMPTSIEDRKRQYRAVNASDALPYGTVQL